MNTTIAKVLLFFLFQSLPFLDAIEYGFHTHVGYRQDYLKWELAGPYDVPKVMSELIWKDLKIVDVEVQFRTTFFDKIYLRCNGEYGWIAQGKNRDSDYFQEARGQQIFEYSRSENKANKGQVYDVEIGLGYVFQLCMQNQSIQLIPLIGCSTHVQHLHLYDGVQKIFLGDPSFEGLQLSGLDSTYKTKWHGPWVGLEIYCNLNEQTVLGTVFEYHWLCYHARGNWNLRPDILGDFIHTGFGRGYFASLYLDHYLCFGWQWGLYGQIRYAHLKNGKDLTLIAIPSNAISDTSYSAFYPQMTEGKLRSVRWISFCLGVTLGYSF